MVRFEEHPGTKLLLPYSKYRHGLGARFTIKPVLISGINGFIPVANRFPFRSGFDEQLAGFTKESKFGPGALGE